MSGQDERLEQQRIALLHVLDRYPALELESCTTVANSVKHQFRIRNRSTKRWHILESIAPDDFTRPEVEQILNDLL